jgi:hypothetical protein
MACIDCHVQDELMGDGAIYGFSHQQLKVNCQDCHGTYTQEPTEAIMPEGGLMRAVQANPNYTTRSGDKVLITERGAILANVRREDGFWVLTSKATGRKHVIPQLKGKEIVNHVIPEHIQNMECYSCHAAWSFQDYGLNLMFDKSIRYEQWRALWAQNDPQVQELLGRQLRLDPSDRTPPVTFDWLTREPSRGVWYSGWNYRRWENNILGRNSSGKVSIFRPQSQFLVTQIDENGSVMEGSRIPQTGDQKPGWAMNPYAPHTIQRETVGCEGCHLNPKAIGLGLIRFREATQGHSIVPLTQPQKDGIAVDHGLEQMVSITGQPLQRSTHPGARPFNQAEIKGLLEKSPAYIRFWLMEWEHHTHLEKEKNLGKP